METLNILLIGIVYLAASHIVYKVVKMTYDKKIKQLEQYKKTYEKIKKVIQENDKPENLPYQLLKAIHENVN